MVDGPIDLVEQNPDIKPELLIADAAYGCAEMPGWIAE